MTIRSEFIHSCCFVLITLILAAILLLPGCQRTPSADDKVTAVESGLLPPVVLAGDTPYALAERMQFYNVPGVSIAAIENFEIAWVRHYGLRDADLELPVTDSTIFLVGSLSKAMAAVTALKLVAEERLDLDAGINDYLTSWQVPDNEFTERSPVTLRRLLNHSGGINFSPGFSYFPDRLPTLLQELQGESPASSVPAHVIHEPGSAYQYSNAGFAIIQLAIGDVTGDSYAHYADTAVFPSLEMRLSTLEQPLPEYRAAEASAGHRADGRAYEIKRYCYPISAAGGLYTTAADYARLLIEIQRALRDGSGRVLSQELAREMTRPHEAKEYGLGVFMRNLGDEGYFGHMGDSRGFVGAFAAHPTVGFGAVVLMNGDRGILLGREIMRSIAAAYNWPAYLPPALTRVVLDADLQRDYVGRYRVGADRVIAVELREDALFLIDWDPAGTPLYAISQDTLVTTEREGQVVFVRDESGHVTHVMYHFTDDIGRLIGKPAAAERLQTGEMAPIELVRAGNMEAAVAAYVRIKQAEPENPYVSEQRLNSLGYQFLNAGSHAAAIAVFRANIELYPQSGNCHDSMGEAVLASGDRTGALQYYREAYRLNPDNSNAAAVIARLLSEGVK